MVRLLPFITLFLSLVGQSHADTRVLVVSGGGPPSADYPKYENTSKLVYEVSAKKGWTTLLAASRGKWDFAKPDQIVPATSSFYVEQQVTAIGKDAKPGDSILVFITDHGTGDTENPISGGLILAAQDPMAAARERAKWEEQDKANFVETLQRLAVQFSKSGKLTGTKEELWNASFNIQQYASSNRYEAEHIFLEFRTRLELELPDLNSLVRVIQKEIKKQEPKETKGNDGSSPELGGEPDLTLNDFGGYLKKGIPTGVSVKLIGTECFAGGVHHISFALDNVCSVAATDHKNPHYTDPNNTSVPFFADGFWKTIDAAKFDLNGDGKVSFYEAYVAGRIQDWRNGGRAQISSAAYIDYTKKEGAYAPSNSVENDHELKDFYGLLFPRLLSQKPIDYDDPIKKFPADQNLACRLTDDPTDKINHLWTSFDEILKKLNPTEVNSSSQPDSLPTELKEVSKSIKKWSDANRDQFGKKLKLFQEQFASLKKEFDSLPATDQTTRNAEFTKKFDDLEENAKKTLAEFFGYFEIAQDIAKAKEFLNSKDTTGEQKKKFMALHQCEWGPL